MILEREWLRLPCGEAELQGRVTGKLMDGRGISLPIKPRQFRTLQFFFIRGLIPMNSCGKLFL